MERFKTRSGFLLAIGLAVVVGLMSATMLLLFANTPPPPYYVINDLNGANDEPGQKDLTRMGRYDDPAGFLDIFWSWDEGTTGGNTLDACALFDSDGDGNVNYAICGQVDSAFRQTSLSPKAYSCDDTDKFHCLTAIALNPVGDDLLAGTLGGLVPDASLQTNTDPFVNGANAPNDVTLRVRVKKTFLGNSAMTNVCTYPSNLNSDYSDCVSNEGGGFLQIVKNTTGGDGSFTFKANPVTDGTGSPCPQGDPSSCRSYSIATSAGTGSGIIGAAANAVMSVSEVVPAGWILSPASCQVEGQQTTAGSFDGVATVSGIPIVSGKFTTCTFTNAKQPAKLTVTKVVTTDNGGTAVASDFTLKVGNTVVTSGVQGQFPAGDYVISETGGPSGYAGTISGACAANGSIHMEPGQVYACTITNNDAAPVLSLSKSVINDNGGSASGTDFTLTATCTTPGTCGLDNISGNGGASSSASFKAGTYALSESGGPAGYTATAWNCTGGVQNGSNVTLAVGQSASCVITNNDQQGTLIVKKVVINDDGGSKVATNFTFKVGNDAAVAFLQDTDALHGKNTLPRNAGTYTITEPAVAGYTTTYDNCSNVVLANGGTQTCTITNNDQPGTLVVKKVVINNNGGAGVATDFSFKVNNAAAVAFLQDNDAAHGKNTLVQSAGVYTITEPEVTGYAVSYDGCTNVALGNGETKTCTITNDDQQGTLLIKKVVVNDNGGTAVASNFSFSINGGPAVSFLAGGTNSVPADADSYTVVEGSAPGYTVSYNNCTNVNVSIGETETCTITNNDVAPQLTLIKFVDNSTTNDASKTAADFLLMASGTGVSVSGASGVTSGSNFRAGTYSLSEANTDGYVAAAWSCNGGLLAGNNITLGLGQIATCSVLNTAVNVAPQVVVDKSVSPKNLDSTGGTVTFTVKVINQSGVGDPYTITSLTDDVYGDLTDSLDSKVQDNNTCSSAVGTVVPGGSTYTCTWTSYFPPLPANQTMSERDIVTVIGTDDDNAGTSSIGTDTDDATVTQSLPIVITNGDCVIEEYTRIFSQDAAYHFTATNSGQFFYNLSISGTPGETRHVTLELPWPFVTQGAQPVHVYDSVDFANNCFSNYIGAYSFDSHVYLKDYQVNYPTVKTGYLPTLDKVKVELEVLIPDTGFAFIRQHMDDGLKGPKVDINGDGILDYLSYGKDGADNATNPANGGILMPEGYVHPFSMWGFKCSATDADCDITDVDPLTNTDLAISGGTTLTNDNQFQKNVGVGGIVTYTSINGEVPVTGLTVELRYGNALVGSAITDEFGLYTIAHKHKGKADLYSIIISQPFADVSVFDAPGTIDGMSAGQPPSTIKSATIKANGLVIVDFPLVP